MPSLTSPTCSLYAPLQKPPHGSFDVDGAGCGIDGARDTAGEGLRELSSRLSGGAFSATCVASVLVRLRNMLVNFRGVAFDSKDVASVSIEGVRFKTSPVWDPEGEFIWADFSPSSSTKVCSVDRR